MRNTHPFATAASVVALAAIAILMLLLLPAMTSAASAPPCPSSWPSETQTGPVLKEQYGRISHQGFHTDSNGDRWFVVRSTDSNGNTTGRAYPASDRYTLGYVIGSADETCIAKQGSAGDHTDRVGIRQVIHSAEREYKASPEPDPPTPPTIQSILDGMSFQDQQAAILCLLDLVGNEDPETFLNDPDNVQPAIDAGCIPAQ